MNTQERRRLLEEVMELKSQYYIGSLSAFKYLKARKWLEEVLRAIYKLNPTLSKKHGLTMNHIAWLVSTTQVLLSRILEITSARMSTPSYCSLMSDHAIAPLDLHPYGGVHRDEETYVWSMNFPGVLTTFLEDTPPGLADQKIRRMLFGFLSRIFRIGILPIRFVETGEIVTYPEFCKNLKYRGGNPAGAWAWSDCLLRLAPDDPDYGLISEKQRSVLQKALSRRDFASAHSVLKCAEIKNALDMCFSGGDSSTDHPMITDDWLYDRSLYERAEREYTLGYISIQRRVLLNEVHRWGDELYTQPAHVFVDMLAACWWDMIAESAKRLESFRSHHAPAAYRNYEEKLLRKRRYIFTAINENRRWLIEFLSR